MSDTLNTGRLTSAERTEIQRLADRGLKSGQIAQRMRRHPGTINFAMTAMGLRAPTERAFSYDRGGRAVRSFTPDEDALIAALRCQGYTMQTIADVCGKRFGHPRTPATISIRLRMVAAREVERDDA